MIFALAVTVRSLLAVFAPGGGGDTESYTTVALNVLQNFCVSQSDPSGGQCLASWGGNQGPGYPAFVALVWATVGTWEPSVRLVQGVVAGAAIVRLAFAVGVLTRRRAIALVCGVVLAVSPLQAAWSRMFLTESLALATTTFVIAELLLSLANKKLRVWPLGLTLTLAVFVRYDAALLAIPIAIAALYIHGWRDGIMRGAVVAAIVTIPLGGWGARGAANELGWIPPRIAAFEGGDPAYGYFDWASTWSRNQYERPAWAFPIHVAKYSWIQIPDHAFRLDAERTVVNNLLAELAAYDDQAMPMHIDAIFADLARGARVVYPFNTRVVVPLVRAADMWGNPFYSFGWPSEIGDTRPNPSALITEKGLFGAVFELVTQYPSQVFVKGVVGIYRYVLLLVFAGLLVLAATGRTRGTGAVLVLALSYAVARTVPFSLSHASETRYMIEAIPLIEVAVIMWIMGSVR